MSSSITTSLSGVTKSAASSHMSRTGSTASTLRLSSPDGVWEESPIEIAAWLRQIGLAEKATPSRYAGRILWLIRNRLSGSYLFLSETSRS
jgi:hypothetical protein